MVFEGKWDGNFKKDRESNGESNVWFKADGEKENREPDGDVRMEGNSGSDGKGEWSGMVRACVEEGWWARSEKSIGVWSEGQEEARNTNEDVEDSRVKESKSVGLEKKGAMNRARWRVGVREIAARVNPATPVYGDKPGSKLDWWWWFPNNFSNDSVESDCALSFSDFSFIFYSTKYIGGHSDITAGSLTLSSQELFYQCYELRKFLGGCLVSMLKISY